jgi:hypothetical protein
MQAIVIDCVPIVDPQLAPIIGDNTELIVGCLVNSQAACPANSKVIASSKARPSATSVSIVHEMSPSSHVGFVDVEILATAALAKVEGILPEETSAISGTSGDMASSTRPHNSPSVASIVPSVPEQHPCVSTALKHFKSY